MVQNEFEGYTVKNANFTPWVHVANAYEGGSIYGVFETVFKKVKRYKVRLLCSVDLENMGIEGSIAGYDATLKTWGLTNVELLEVAA